MQCHRPQSRIPARYGLILWALVPAAGCHIFESDSHSNAEKVVRAPKPSDDSVTLEVLLVLVPNERAAAFDRLWLSVDEQVIDAATRGELLRNGFRAGVVGPSPPDELAELLNMDTKSATTSQTDDAWQAVPLDKPATLTGHVRQLRPRERMEIQASVTHDQLDLFLVNLTGLSIRTVQNAQGLFALQWTPLPHGRIQAELTPELHHGSPKQRFAVGEANDWRVDYSRQKEVYEQLRIQAPLAAGQMLIVSGDPEAPGSLGYHFHSLPTPSGMNHRLVVIRLAQAAN